MIQDRIQEAIGIKEEMLRDDELLDQIRMIATKCINAFRNGHKVLLCGNGGSAADAQHIAAELSGKYLKDRSPLDAEALHVNTSYLTAVANDYGFEHVFARLVEARGSEGDVMICLSTSGNSKNILNAIKKANGMGLKSVGLSGKSGGEMKNLCKITICVPSEEVPRIQETHILIGHIICEIIESEIFPDK
ncbi:MAG: SIS domain-containing protein [Bacteroidales bacterium]